MVSRFGHGSSRLEPAAAAHLPGVVKTATVGASPEQHRVGVCRATDSAGVQYQRVPAVAMRAAEFVAGCESECLHRTYDSL